ncbi:FAD-dependent monooxygenase [Polycladidibacter stylochi]|uniref:FAD-dependent monooxygenase n=1 Tax=Polycladidibacter stylochi TaxID=1807766 RepID=UPI000B0D8F61|nr:TIGR03862 family flavoprotein [Pseudovibrio stylochi]
MGKQVVIIGAGPAGLIAAQMLAEQGIDVAIYDQKKTAARKFLMAGHGGLNLTHSEDLSSFIEKYRPFEPKLIQAIQTFTPEKLCAWSSDLGIDCFTGSSGRIFPQTFKASPLLRAWLLRLEALGVRLLSEHRWIGFGEAAQLLFETPTKDIVHVKADCTLLALGGASWPKLGSTGDWSTILQKHHIELAPFLPSNCGLQIPFSSYFIEKFKGQPLKRIALTHDGRRIEGEALIDKSGLEGGAIYALSSFVRDDVLQHGFAMINVDLRPDQTLAQLQQRLLRPRGKQSLSNYLRKAVGLSPIAIALLREAGPVPSNATELAVQIKALPFKVNGYRGLERAISSAGGLRFSELDDQWMIKKIPGIFAAGEMLDWEAPTGGYLLQGTFASGVAAAKGMMKFLGQ